MTLRRAIHGNRRGKSAGAITRGAIATGATLWLRADVGVIGNPNVTAWNDQSGNGNNATPPGGAPQLAANINGRASIRFGGGDVLTFASFTAGLTGLEIFIVGKNLDDGATSSTPVAFNDDTGGDNLVPFSADRKIYDDTGSTTRQTTNFAPAAGKWNAPWLYNVVATASEWSMFFNNGTGTPDFTQGTNTFGYGTRAIGRGTSVSRPMIGDISEVVLYPAKLSAPNKALTVATLKNWYGIP